MVARQAVTDGWRRPELKHFEVDEMSGMHKRHEGMDAKMAADSEFRFKVNNRRNRLVAQWAGGLLGKSEEEIEDVRNRDDQGRFRGSGATTTCFGSSRPTLAAGGVAKTDAEIHHAMSETMDEALEHALGG